MNMSESANWNRPMGSCGYTMLLAAVFYSITKREIQPFTFEPEVVYVLQVDKSGNSL